MELCRSTGNTFPLRRRRRICNFHVGNPLSEGRRTCADGAGYAPMRLPVRRPIAHQWNLAPACYQQVGAFRFGSPLGDSIPPLLQSARSTEQINYRLRPWVAAGRCSRLRARVIESACIRASPSLSQLFIEVLSRFCPVLHGCRATTFPLGQTALNTGHVYGARIAQK